MPKSPQFDFRYLKAQVSIGQVLASYGLDRHLRRKHHSLLGSCPLHRGDNPTAFRVDLQNNMWHCFTACGGGDTVELIRRIENCSYAEAARHLYRLSNGPKPSSSMRAPAPQSCPPSIFFPFRKKIPLNPKVSFLQEVKKISPQTATHFEAGTCEESPFLRGKVAVRIHDLQGNPLGYCGRRLDRKDVSLWGKWCFPKNFPKKDVLYNAHRAICLRHRGVVVVECPWAVMRLAQAGIYSAIALLGTVLTPTQAAWLVRAPLVLLMLDADPPGKKASLAIAATLRSKTHVLIHELPRDMEPEDLTDNELKLIAANLLFSS